LIQIKQTHPAKQQKQQSDQDDRNKWKWQSAYCWHRPREAGPCSDAQGRSHRKFSTRYLVDRWTVIVVEDRDGTG
jgi:hypothetical protein